MSKDYSREELWDIAAQLLHNQDYSKRYTQYLSDIIGNKEAKILDTACGSGFPSIELLGLGFKNITGFDGNAEALEIFRKKCDQIPLIHGDWKTINETIKDQFDIVLNVDNALPYLDSWMKEVELSANIEEVKSKVRQILRNFFLLTKNSGKIVVAISKNNDKSYGPYKEYDLEEGLYQGHNVKAVWKLKYDWENGIKTFINELTIDGNIYKTENKSYLLIKEDVADLLKEVGYARAQVIETDDLYDNFIVGDKFLI